MDDYRIKLAHLFPLSTSNELLYEANVAKVQGDLGTAFEAELMVVQAKNIQDALDKIEAEDLK